MMPVESTGVKLLGGVFDMKRPVTPIFTSTYSLFIGFSTKESSTSGSCVVPEKYLIIEYSAGSSPWLLFTRISFLPVGGNSYSAAVNLNSTSSISPTFMVSR
jgi:hypothetical protein